jgi:GNAT superfamily N-acetyltransferase/predicted SprT family Zn-dependent metalloprotease
MQDWEPILREVGQVLHGVAMAVRSLAAAEVPVTPDCQDKLDYVAATAAALPDQLVEVDRITRVAQKELWRLVDEPGEHDGMWAEQGRGTSAELLPVTGATAPYEHEVEHGMRLAPSSGEPMQGYEVHLRAQQVVGRLAEHYGVEPPAVEVAGDSVPWMSGRAGRYMPRRGEAGTIVVNHERVHTGNVDQVVLHEFTHHLDHKLWGNTSLDPEQAHGSEFLDRMRGVELTHRKSAALEPVTAGYAEYARDAWMEKAKRYPEDADQFRANAEREHAVYSDPKRHSQPGQWHDKRPVGWVRRDKLEPYLTHQGDQHSSSPATVDALADDFRNGRGWTDPIHLDYSQERHRVTMSEGNHRWHAATKAGEEYVPVVVHPMSSYLPTRYAEPAIFPQAIMPEGQDSVHPSEVLPLHWMMPEQKTAAHEPISWDQITERHPETYGVERDEYDEPSGDGEDIARAAGTLAFDRPSDPDDEGWHHASDLDWSLEHVDPRHVDYARHESGDYRVRHALEGYRSDPEAVPPAVLVRRHGVYQVADGHHRAEAAHLAGVPLRAYVAHSPHEDEPFSAHDGEPPARGPFHGAEPIPAQHLAAFPEDAAPGDVDTTREGAAEAATRMTAEIDAAVARAARETEEAMRELAASLRGTEASDVEGGEQDYRVQHQPVNGAPLHDLLHTHEGGEMVPKDFYDRMNDYADGTRHDDESMDAIYRAKGRPDAKVKIYRAAPHGVSGINNSDWVSLSRSYAREHAHDLLGRGQHGKVYQATVPAKHVGWDGNSVNEFGYFGPDLKARTRKPPPEYDVVEQKAWLPDGSKEDPDADKVLTSYDKDGNYQAHVRYRHERGNASVIELGGDHEGARQHLLEEVQRRHPMSSVRLPEERTGALGDAVGVPEDWDRFRGHLIDTDADGLTYHYYPAEGGRWPVIKVRAGETPDGDLVGVGDLTWFEEDGPGAVKNAVQMVEVHPDYRRRGIASRLWAHARQINPDLIHSPTDQLPEGTRWAVVVDAREASVAPRQEPVSKILGEYSFDDGADWPSVRDNFVGTAPNMRKMRAGGHVYEVEPTGEARGGYQSGEYKSQHPLRVIRRVPTDEPPTGPREASLGEAERHEAAADTDPDRHGTGEIVDPTGLRSYEGTYAALATGMGIGGAVQHFNQSLRHLSEQHGVNAPRTQVGGVHRPTMRATYYPEGVKGKEALIALNLDRISELDEEGVERLAAHEFLHHLQYVRGLRVSNQESHTPEFFAHVEDLRAGLRAAQEPVTAAQAVAEPECESCGGAHATDDHDFENEFVQVHATVEVEPDPVAPDPVTATKVSWPEAEYPSRHIGDDWRASFVPHHRKQELRDAEPGRKAEILAEHAPEQGAWRRDQRLEQMSENSRAGLEDLPEPTVWHLLRGYGPHPSAPDHEEPEEDPTARATFYHGTVHPFRPGSVVRPAAEHGRGVTFASDTDPGHAYATADRDDAWTYAEKAHGWYNTRRRPGQPTRIPRVYEVEPVRRDSVGLDPQGRGNNPGDVRSPHGFRVLREVPMPEHMGKPADWRH